MNVLIRCLWVYIFKPNDVSVVTKITIQNPDIPSTYGDHRVIGRHEEWLGMRGSLALGHRSDNFHASFPFSVNLRSPDFVAFASHPRILGSSRVQAVMLRIVDDWWLTLLRWWSSWNRRPWRVPSRGRPGGPRPCPHPPPCIPPTGIWRAPGISCKRTMRWCKTNADGHVWTFRFIMIRDLSLSITRFSCGSYSFDSFGR